MPDGSLRLRSGNGAAGWWSEVEVSLLAAESFDFVQGSYFSERMKLFLNDVQGLSLLGKDW